MLPQVAVIKQVAETIKRHLDVQQETNPAGLVKSMVVLDPNDARMFVEAAEDIATAQCWVEHQVYHALHPETPPPTGNLETILQDDNILRATGWGDSVDLVTRKAFCATVRTVVHLLCSPTDDRSKAIKDFFGIYLAKFEASAGRPLEDSEYAFDYTTRSDPDLRQSLTVGQIRSSINPTK